MYVVVDAAASMLMQLLFEERNTHLIPFDSLLSFLQEDHTRIQSSGTLR